MVTTVMILTMIMKVMIMTVLDNGRTCWIMNALYTTKREKIKENPKEGAFPTHLY